MDLAEGAGLLYLTLGLIGIFGNGSMAYLLSSLGSYYKSTYMLMVNICAADFVMSLVVGCHVGATLGFNTPIFSSTVVCLLDVCCWFVGILSYAVLAVNRSVGVLQPSATFVDCSRKGTTLMAVLATWGFGIVIGVVASFPSPTLGVDQAILTMNYYSNNTRAQWIMWINVGTNAFSVLIQWVCSFMILFKLYRGKNESHSATHTKEVRLFLQFFYPSIVCTWSSLMFFSLPFYAQHMTKVAFVFSHLIWLGNHICNPFVYLYFNDQVRRRFKHCVIEPPCLPGDDYGSSTYIPESIRLREDRRRARHYRAKRSLSVPLVPQNTRAPTVHSTEIQAQNLMSTKV